MTVNLKAVDVTVGTGGEQNRKPFDFYYRFSLFETLYYPDEINTAGYIEAISIYNNFLNSIDSSGHIQFWLGTTDLPDLSGGWIPSTQLTSVFNRTVVFPSGQNVIRLNLNTPYLYTGGNLVLLARTPGNTSGAITEVSFICQTIGTNRARDYYSNTTNADHTAPPMTGTYLTLSGQFPKTTFHFTDTPSIVDLGITAFTGPTDMTIGQSYTHNVTVNNPGTAAQSTYNVKLYGWNNQELATATGTALASGATTEIPITWTPNAGEGYTTLYAKVIVANDQNLFNNISQTMNVVFLPEGGGGITPPDPVPAQIPIDMSSNNSIFETIIPASYLADQNFTANRIITSIRFYNNFVDNMPAKPTKIWLGNTNQTDLSAGWIPSGQLISVFDGNVNYPNGTNTVEINLLTPFYYTGGNIVLLMHRPMDTNTYAGSNVFTCYPGNTNVSRNVASNTVVLNPASPPEGTSYLTNLYPAIDFVCNFTILGSLKGLVSNSQNQPITNATILLNPSDFTVTTNAYGVYNFSWLLPGTYQVTVSAPGYVEQSVSVNVSELASTLLNIRLHLITDLVITGRVVSNENLGVGIAHATVEIVGVYTTAVATNSSGDFIIYDVPANQTYVLRAMHPSYFTYSGSVIMGSLDVNVGDLPLEIDTTPVTNEVSAISNTLAACYPNPFNNQTTIGYKLKESVNTSLVIYNIKGQKVRTLVSDFSKAGEFSAVWNGTDDFGKKVSNGVYYYKMSAGNFTAVRKLVLIR